MEEGLVQRADDYGVLVQGLLQQQEGCTNEDACNYNSAATIDDASCVLPTDCETCSGATDGTGAIVDNDADDDGICDDVGVTELEDLGIKFYPNPATEKLYLVADHSYDLLYVEVMNIMGIVLSERELRTIQSNDVIEFSIKDLSTGLYLLKVSTNTEQITIAWMKQ